MAGCGYVLGFLKLFYEKCVYVCTVELLLSGRSGTYHCLYLEKVHNLELHANVLQ